MNPGTPSVLTVSGTGTIVAGLSTGFAVEILDAYGNVASNYTGTVGLGSSDPQATLPAAYTFTTSTKTANLISDALEAGMIGVNSLAISTPETPFGGVKESGYGHEGGIEGLEAYTNKKLVIQA